MMKIQIDIYLHDSHGDSVARLEQVLLAAIHDTKEILMAAIDDLEAAVAKNTTVTGSALALIQGLKGLLDAAIAANAAGDPTKLAALSAQLGADDQALSDALTANTPAA